ncbi:PepSY-associated TM helix domain-containing protein [Symbiobacterium thermophilum]|uniref:PepSY-associated TM helix domain-containing protein n=1 Tax=Symbiobacterium thermophilum TaxID=2734 RepID=UPI002353928E|nr:PepSY domain-containing protein [Symbiobacterium thermophilum]
MKQQGLQQKHVHQVKPHPKDFNIDDTDGCEFIYDSTIGKAIISLGGYGILAGMVQIEAVQKAYPDASITRYKPPFEADRSAEVGISGKDGLMTVFVNPYNGKILGDLKDDEEFMNKVRRLHGELMIGTTGDRLVEMASCWAMILLITGLYLWWPHNRKGIFGTLIPRFSKGKRMMLRDLHAVPAFWFSLFIAIFILTGLPWSGLWGDLIKRVATATETGYPTGLWDGNLPKSTIPSKDVAKVPWAAENLPVPESGLEKIKAFMIFKKLSLHMWPNKYRDISLLVSLSRLFCS